MGVGGVVIESERVLLILRGNEPLKGQWSIPGGTLELGETLVEGTARELTEETGLQVRVMEMIEGSGRNLDHYGRAQAAAISFCDCRFFVPTNFRRSDGWRRRHRRGVGG